METRIESGIDYLDQFDALSPGRLTVMLGQTACGKTVTMARIASSLNHRGESVIIRGTPELLKYQRLFVGAGGVTYLLRGTETSEEMARLTVQRPSHRMPRVVLVDDLGDLVNQFLKECPPEKWQYGQRAAIMGQVAMSLHQLALQANCAVMAMLTVNRTSGLGAQNWLPSLPNAPSDVAYCADNIFAMERVPDSARQSRDGLPLVSFKALKSRNHRLYP